MNIQTRISKLEEVASSLPPDGAAILARLERMTVKEGEAYIKQMTDEELEAAEMVGVDHGELDVTKLTDEELERIANGEDPNEALKGKAE